MAYIKHKNNSNFIGSTVVGIKERKFTAFSKAKNKNVDIVEHKGGVKLSNGNFLSIKVSKTSDAKYKETNKSYWVEVAEFSPNNDR